MQDSRLLDVLRGLSPEDFPKTVKRLRQRKNETVDKWKTRALEHLEKLMAAEEAKEIQSDGVVSDMTIRLIQDAIAKEGNSSCSDNYSVRKEWAPLVPTYTSPHERKGWPVDGPQTDRIRGIMGSWVQDTLVSKEAEASCDLDCLTCPTARLLVCGLQNKTAYIEDGYVD